MARILTLTMNPAIDVAMSVDRVEPTRKLRSARARRDAGGGGINVARVARRLGAEVTAIYPAGGVTGELLRRLVEAEDVRSVAVPVEGDTRESFTALETSTGDEYRFVLEGPQLSEDERRACLDALAAEAPSADLIVASGSLPPGVPDDLYAEIAETVERQETRLVLDASGSALKAALEHGVFLVKPNLRELQELTGAALADEAARLDACRALTSAGEAQAVALTLGDQGAVLVTRAGAWRAPPLPVETASAVGAGDSFLGGMAWALASGRTLEDAFRWGVAAGSAALLTGGTELSRAPDVRRLVDSVVVEPAAP